MVIKESDSGRLDPAITYENTQWIGFAMSHGGAHRIHEHNKHLYEQGAPADRLVLIIRGLVVRVFSDAYMQEPHMIELHGPGDFVGLQGAIGGDGCSFTDSAVVHHNDKALTIAFPLDAMNKWNNDNPLHTHIIQNARKQFAWALMRQAQTISHFTLPAAQRVKLKLIDIAKRFGEIDSMNGNVRIPPAILQTTIADLAGTTRETVSRVFTALRKDGLLITAGTRKGFAIPSMARLEEAANNG